MAKIGVKCPHLECGYFSSFDRNDEAEMIKCREDLIKHVAEEHTLKEILGLLKRFTVGYFGEYYGGK